MIASATARNGSLNFQFVAWTSPHARTKRCGPSSSPSSPQTLGQLPSACQRQPPRHLSSSRQLVGAAMDKTNNRSCQARLRAHEFKRVTGRVGGLRRLLVQVFADFLQVLRLFVQGLAWHSSRESAQTLCQPRCNIAGHIRMWALAGRRPRIILLKNNNDPSTFAKHKLSSSVIRICLSPNKSRTCQCQERAARQPRNEITGLLSLSLNLLLNGELAFDLLPGHTRNLCESSCEGQQLPAFSGTFKFQSRANSCKVRAACVGTTSQQRLASRSMSCRPQPCV